MLNRLMTGWCPRTVTAEVPLAFSPKKPSIFKKVLHLKDLNHHLECTDVSFKPENGAFSKIKSDTQTDRLTDRQTDKVTTVTLSCMRAEG